MTDLIRRFEIYILRPLHILFIGSALVFLFNGMWILLVGCLICLFFLGIIGSKLHPSQSASDLALGPLNNPVAKKELEHLSDETKRMLIGFACTKTALLVGFATGLVLWGGLSWHWYYALLVAWISILFFGGFLKTIFNTV